MSVRYSNKHVLRDDTLVLEVVVCNAYGILDTGFRYDLSVDEAIDLRKRAIYYHATHRGAASGGINNLFFRHQGRMAIGPRH